MSQRSLRRAQARRIDREARRAAVLRRRAELATGAAIGAVALFAGSAQAATLTVNSVKDGPADACDSTTPDGCTLRDAVTEANLAPDEDTITFASTLSGATIVLTSGELPAGPASNLTIDGNAGGALVPPTVSGNDASRIFSVGATQRLAVSDLRLTDGNGAGATASGAGGAVFVDSDGTFAMVDGTISDSAAERGGAIAGVTPGGPGGPSQPRASVQLTRTEIEDNSATVSGGGVDLFGALTLTASQVTGNTVVASDPSALPTFGGGVAVSGKYAAITMSDSTVSGNSAGQGAGITLFAGPNGSAGSTIAASTISGNTATRIGGGIDAYLGSGRRLAISGSTISGNDAGLDGGGVAARGAGAVELSTSTVSGNDARSGGGVFAGAPVNDATAAFVAQNTTIAGNTATGEGGGINVEQGSAGDAAVARRVELPSTIVADNTANGTPADLDGPNATTADKVGLAHSLVEAPGDAQLAPDSTRPSILGEDPKLGPLTPNAGATATHNPSFRSPALDKGSALSGPQDQRRKARTFDAGPSNAGDGTDIGAVELQDDEIPFEVHSVKRLSATPASDGPVVFRVVFTEAVAEGLGIADFALTKTGTAGGTISSVSDGPAGEFEVEADDVTGDGTLRLDVLDDGSVENGADETLGSGFTGGETVTIDTTAPVVKSITRVGSQHTTASSVDFLVTFAEDVENADLGDLSVVSTGDVAGAEVTNVSGSGATRTVTVSTGSGDGTVGLRVETVDAEDDDSASDTDDGPIADRAGNAIEAAYAAGESVIIDRTAPKVVSVAPAGASPTNAEEAEFAVTFDEVVGDVAAADFAIDAGDGVDGASVTSASPSGASSPARSARGRGTGATAKTWTVRVSTGTGDGRLGLDVTDDATIDDLAGNALVDGFTGGRDLTIDKTAPQVTINQASDQEDPTSDAAVGFTAMATEAVTGLEGADIAVGGAAGPTGAAVSGSGATFRVDLSGMTKDGTVTASIPAGVVRDAAGNNNTAATGTDNSVTWTKPRTAAATPPPAVAPVPPPAPAFLPLTCRRVPTLTGHSLYYARVVLRRDGCTSPLVIDNPKRGSSRNLIVTKQAPAAGIPRFGTEPVRVIVKRKPRRRAR